MASFLTFSNTKSYVTLTFRRYLQHKKLYALNALQSKIIKEESVAAGIRRIKAVVKN